MYTAFQWIALMEWGTPAAMSISGGLANTAIGLTLAILSYRIIKLGLAAISGARDSNSNLLFDVGALAVRAVVILFVITQWPQFMGYIKSTQRDIAYKVSGTSDPLQMTGKVFATMDYYETLIATGSAGWLSSDTVTPPNKPSQPTSLFDQAVSLFDQAVIQLLMMIKSLMDAPALLIAYSINFIAAVAVWVVCAIIVVAMAMPLLMLFVALAVAPLPIATFMSSDRLSLELTSGWLDLIMTTLLAFPILMILIALMEPSMSAAPFASSLAPTGVERMKQISRDLTMLFFFGTFLAMPMSIAAGIINGRVPSANPAMLLINLLTSVAGRSVRAAKKLLKK